MQQWGYAGVKNTASQVLNITLGVSPITIGFVLGFARLWDAFTDPMAGSISDNLRTRWGRRRPCIFLGALGAGLCFPLFWSVPSGLSGPLTFAWLLTAIMLFYAAFAFFDVPYNALGYEVAHSPNERTRLFAYNQAFATIAIIGTAWIFPLIHSGALGSPRESAIWTGILVGLAIAATGIVPALFIKDPPDASLTRQRKVSLREALRQASRSKPFMLVALATSITGMGLNMVNGLGTYVNIYYVYGGNKLQAGLLGGIQLTVSCVVTLLVTPITIWLGRRIGSRNTYIACLWLGIAGCVAKWFFYTPDLPWLQIGVVFFMGPALAGSNTFANAMVGDISEHEARTSGLKIQGTYSAVLAWLRKSGLAVALVVAGYVLDLSGFDVTRSGPQEPSTLFIMRVLFSYFPMLTFGIGILLLSRYSLPES